MDKIYIKDLQIHGYHGVFEEEKKLGQRFILSIELSVNLSEAGKSDDLTKTVHYGNIAHEVEKLFKSKKHDLIEKAAEEVAMYILSNYELVKEVKVFLKKPWAPIGLPVEYAAVEITRKRHKAYIAIGSNMGNKRENIDSAIEIINTSKYSKVTKISNFYETEPFGYLEQDEFLNCAIEIETFLLPKELMEFLLEVEKDLKRERIIKWGPRTLDLDIIFYDDLVSSEEDIVVPHPRMHERMFVLEPLEDIAPYALHPLLNKRVFQLKEELGKK